MGGRASMGLVFKNELIYFYFVLFFQWIQDSDVVSGIVLWGLLCGLFSMKFSFMYLEIYSKQICVRHWNLKAASTIVKLPSKSLVKKNRSWLCFHPITTIKTITITTITIATPPKRGLAGNLGSWNSVCNLILTQLDQIKVWLSYNKHTFSCVVCPVTTAHP